MGDLDFGLTPNVWRPSGAGGITPDYSSGFDQGSFGQSAQTVTENFTYVNQFNGRWRKIPTLSHQGGTDVPSDGAWHGIVRFYVPIAASQVLVVAGGLLQRASGGGMRFNYRIKHTVSGSVITTVNGNVALATTAAANNVTAMGVFYLNQFADAAGLRVTQQVGAYIWGSIDTETGAGTAVSAVNGDNTPVLDTIVRPRPSPFSDPLSGAPNGAGAIDGYFAYDLEGITDAAAPAIILHTPGSIPYILFDISNKPALVDGGRPL
jgi:hypothetical protein